MLALDYQYFETIDSTNNEIKRRAAQGAEEGLVVSAGMQSAGRGRSGHDWKSPVGESIATSLLLRPTLPVECLSSLTLVAALAVRRAIYGLYDIDTEIKWPNDIVRNGKKICGILTELSLEQQKAEYVVVGIGVNVHNRNFPEELLDKATSLDMESHQMGRGDLPPESCQEQTRRIWEEFALLYEVFSMTGDLSVVMEEYNRFLANRNRQVRVMDPKEPWEGIARGIDESGALLVETKEDLRRVDAGEVSVRGIYGYV